MRRLLPACSCRRNASSKAALDGAAPVHDEALAGHIGTRLRCEEDGGASDLFRLPDPSERSYLLERCLCLGILPQRAGKIRANDTRRYRVDADIMATELDREVADK